MSEELEQAIESYKDYIRKKEGFRSNPYDDAGGKPIKSLDEVKGTATVGYGFIDKDLVNRSFKRPMTKEEAEMILDDKVRGLATRIEKNLEAHGAPSLSPDQKRALYSFAFNAGEGALKWGEKRNDSIYQHLGRGDVQGAAQKLSTLGLTAKRKNGPSEYDPALEERRREEASLLAGDAGSFQTTDFSSMVGDINIGGQLSDIIGGFGKVIGEGNTPRKTKDTEYSYNIITGEHQPSYQLDNSTTIGQAMGEGRTAEVIDPMGRAVQIDSGSLDQALLEGYKLSTADQIKARKEKEDFESREMDALAYSLAGGLTLGASNWAARAAGKEEYVKNLYKHNPIISGLGDVAGTAISAIFTGGASALSKGAAKAGSSLAARVTSKELAKKAIATASKGAIEGGVYGGIEAAKELALGSDRSITEIVASNVGAGAFFGGVMDLSALGIKGLANRAQTAIKGIGPDIGLSDAAMIQHSGMKPSQIRGLIDWEFGGNEKAMLAEVGDVMRSAIYEPIDASGKYLGKPLSLTQAVRKSSASNLHKQLKLRKKLVGKAINQVDSEVDKIIRMYRELPPDQKGSQLGLFDDTIASPRLDEIITDIYEQAYILYESGHRLDANWLARRADDFKLAYQDKDFGWKEAMGIKRSMDDDLFGLSGELDKAKNSLKLNGLNASRKMLRTRLEKTIDALYAVDPEFMRNKISTIPDFTPHDYKKLNHSYFVLSEATKGAKEGATKDIRSAISTNVFSGTTPVAGAAIGGALGGFVPGAAGLAAGVGADILTKQANKLVVPTIALMGKGHHSRAQQFIHRLVKETREAVDNKVNKFFFPKVKAPKGTAKAVWDIGKAKVIAKTLSEEVSAANNNPENYIQSLNTVSDGLNNIGDDLSVGSLEISMSGLDFLAQRVPLNPGVASLWQGGEDWDIPDSEAMKFLRYTKAVFDPVSVLDDLNNGDISQGSVEALREVYPSLYQDMSTKALEALQKVEGKISQDKKVSLSIFLGMPVSTAMDSNFLFKMQQRIAGQKQANEEEQKTQQMRAKIKKFTVDNLTRTATQQVENRK